MNRTLCSTCHGAGFVLIPGSNGVDKPCPNRDCYQGTVEVVPDRQQDLSRIEDGWEGRPPFVGSCE